jgi:hypothetical protein
MRPLVLLLLVSLTGCRLSLQCDAGHRLAERLANCEMLPYCEVDSRELARRDELLSWCAAEDMPASVARPEVAP